MVVYKITNKINGKSYIGQTIVSIEERFIQHCRLNNGCVALRNAIKKHGKKYFEIKILMQCNSVEEMNHREQYCIKLFNTLSPHGYNLKSGSTKTSFYTQESRMKMSKSHIGNPGYWLGKHHTEETKFKLSRQKLGVNNPNFGKPKTQMIKEKISLAQSNKKAIICNETRVVYRSLGLAARTLGLIEQNVRAVLKGRRKSCGGLTFSYHKG